MKLKKLTLTYLVCYLAIGGVGLTLFPAQVLNLFMSNGSYGDIMPRMTGMFMCALSYLIFRMLRNEDWHYYRETIYVRSVIVVIMAWLWMRSDDPMFLVLLGIVLVGLVPSVITHFRTNHHGNA